MGFLNEIKSKVELNSTPKLIFGEKKKWICVPLEEYKKLLRISSPNVDNSFYL